MKDYYLIGEIGINHNGDIEIAKKLIDAVHCCGWHCAKFQKRNPDICIPEDQKNIIRDTPWGKMTYLDYKKKIEFGKKEYDIIDQYCKNKKIEWSASVWDIDSLNFLMQYDIPFIKIPSAHITNLELLREAYKTKKKILLSTGMSTIEDIDNALKIVKNNVILMHTNSCYPTPNNELNLSLIKTLRKKYNIDVGYSGHEIDVEPTIIAYMMGARILERHITLDHDMWGSDQKASLEVIGMATLEKRLAKIPDMLGDGIKRITNSEIEKLKQLRKNK